MANLFPYQLYLVISARDCAGKSVIWVAEEAIKGGVDIIQLREKNVSAAELLNRAMALKVITDKYGIPLIVNDNFEVASQVQAAGVHVGNNDIAPAVIRKQWTISRPLIGYSIEYLAQLDNEQTALSDYLGVSPVFSTPTKTDTVAPWGLEGIRAIRQLTEKPLVAIGNINLKNASAVIDAGADCFAVVSAICSAADPQRAAYELKNQIIK